MKAAAIVAYLVFATLVAVLTLAVRRLRERVRVEQVEDYLARELDELERRP